MLDDVRLGREQLRTTFDEVAGLYDRARPGYPPELFDDLVALAGLAPGARILEIGCGTGQATAPLVERGFELVCVELGAQLAAVARRKLPAAQVVTAPFESWEPDGRFDAVVAFTALHWVDPDVRYAKPAQILGQGGALAVATTEHVFPEGGDPFFSEIQDVYEELGESADAWPRPDDVAGLGPEIEASGLFGEVAVRRYVREIAYTADEYVDVLETYSGHRTMARGARDRLYGEIRRRLAARPSGRVTKTYLTLLHVARRA